MLKYSIILFVLLFSNSTYSQNSFEKQIGSTGNDYVYSIQKTFDNGLIILGLTDSYGAGGLDIFLTKLDSLNNVVWSKTYGGTSNEPTSGMVIQLSDSNYLMVSHTESFGAAGRDGLIIKVDETGSILWNKRYSNASNETFRGVHELSNGDIVIGGAVNSIIGSTDAMLIRITSNGTPVYANIYGGNLQDNLERVKETIDGNLILAGNSSTFGPASQNFALIKTDMNGAILWEKAYGGAGLDAIQDIEVLADGSFICVGTCDSWGQGGYDGNIMKFDATGLLLWIKSYGGSSEEQFKEVEVLPSGNIMVYGYTSSFGAGQQDLFILKADSNGNMIWAKTYGDTGSEPLGQQDKSFSITTDFNLLMAGYSNSYGSGDYDGLIFKMDTTANRFCEDITSQISLTLPSPTTANSSLTSTTAGTFTIPSVLSSNISIPITTICNCDPGFGNLNFLTNPTDCYGIDFTSNYKDGIDWWWSFGDNQYSDLENPTHTYNEPGTYWVCLTITNSCNIDTTICDSVTVDEMKPNSIGGMENKLLIEFYPNPSNGILTLNVQESGLIRILDLNGKELIQQQVFVGRQIIDANFLSQGIYLIEFSNQNNVGLAKWIIQK